ncbi:MAG: hypothetical protein JNM30_19055 [Rhodospirillales bacterium]|nr:hypothetical protein [Rhodospirillales bacterium]
MHSWNTLRRASAALLLALGLASAPGPAALAQTQDAQNPAARAVPTDQQPAPRTVREKRADGVTVSIPPDLARGAPGGAAMGYTDSTQGAGAGGGWVEPAAMALGYISPGAGSRGYMPGPNATVGPNAGTGAINPLPFQAFSSSAPDSAVNSAPTPAEVGRPEQFLPRPVNCGLRRFGC